MGGGLVGDVLRPGRRHDSAASSTETERTPTRPRALVSARRGKWWSTPDGRTFDASGAPKGQCLFVWCIARYGLRRGSGGGLRETRGVRGLGWGRPGGGGPQWGRGRAGSYRKEDLGRRPCQRPEGVVAVCLSRADRCVAGKGSAELCLVAADIARRIGARGVLPDQTEPAWWLRHVRRGSGRGARGSGVPPPPTSGPGKIA